jgi:hypothetical protein
MAQPWLKSIAQRKSPFNTGALGEAEENRQTLWMFTEQRARK